MSCPICGKTTDTASRPFCSRRCADVDLSRWFNGTYAVPSNDPEDEETLFEELEDAVRRGETPPDKPH